MASNRLFCSESLEPATKDGGKLDCIIKNCAIVQQPFLENPILAVSVLCCVRGSPIYLLHVQA